MAATKTETLRRAARPTLGDRLIRFIFWRRRLSRLLFPSPAEVQFVRVMRGHVLTVPFMRSRRTGFCLAFVWRGKILKRELVHREVRAGRYVVDFGVVTPFGKKAIEIDGEPFHQDVLREQERDDYLRARGWEVLHIKGRRLWREPRRVGGDVLKFLKS